MSERLVSLSTMRVKVMTLLKAFQYDSALIVQEVSEVPELGLHDAEVLKLYTSNTCSDNHNL